jgi:signal peptidase II
MPRASLVASIITIFVIDQAVKTIAARSMPESETRPLAAGFGLRLVRNNNHRFLFSAKSASMVFLLIAMVIGVLLTILSPLTHLGSLGVGLVVGGAAGNLWDRCLKDGVVDFIAFGHWTFNLADVAMICGTVLAAGSLL